MKLNTIADDFLANCQAVWKTAILATNRDGPKRSRFTEEMGYSVRVAERFAPFRI